MASGFGYTGGQSRCYQFFQEFRKCYASADLPAQCAAQQADYFECLHHHKEIARTKAIKEHLIERVAKEIKQARAKGELGASGNPLNLNLIVTEAPPAEKQDKQQQHEQQPAKGSGKEDGQRNEGGKAASGSESGKGGDA